MAGSNAAGSETIKLTITMLVSNRVDTIRKSMDSIKPLLEKAPGELIVVDTGSTDGSIDIVREYTDRIVPFKWCDDFAKARNAGLKDARGEWVMFLDDDEWFEDVTELVDFFKGGEHRVYNTAVYLVRNYSDMKGENWVDSRAHRMVRRYPETRFWGTVHEFLSPQKEPIKYFSAYAHHYGYAFASEEKRREHFDRNIRLIQQELERNPDNLRQLAQAVQEYFGMKELYKVLELCDRVMKLEQMPYYTVYAGYCYNVSLRAYMRMENWKKAYEWGNRLLKEGAPNNVAFLGNIREMVQVCLKAEKYAEGLVCLQKYFEVYEDIKENADREDICFDMDRYFQEKDYEYACLEGIQLAALGKDWEMAGTCIRKKKWDTMPLVLYRETLDCLMEFWTVTEFRQEYSDIFDNIVRHKGFHQQIWDNVGKYAEGDDRAAYQRLLCIIGHCRYDCANTRKYRFLYYASLDQIPGDISLENMLGGLWEGSANPLLWDMEIWDTIDRKDLSVSKAVKDTACDQWFIQVRQWLESVLRAPKSGADPMTQVYRILCRGTEEDDNLHIQFIRLKYQEGVMRRSLTAGGDILPGLENYCDRVLVFYSRIYREEAFHEGSATVLPPEGTFAVYVRQAIHCRQEGDLGAYMRSIGKAARYYPVMKELCKALLHKEEEAGRDRITHDEQLEFAQLAERMKHNVRTLLEDGNTGTARQIILQLKVLIPEDEELQELESAIS